MILPSCNGAAGTPTDSPRVLRNLWSGNTVVPAKFTGMHANYPLKDTAPTYSYGVARSHDVTASDSANSPTKWYNIELSNGVYTWTGADAWITEQVAQGRDIVWTVYGTPQFHAASLAVTDGYGKVGGCSKPTSNSSLSAFVTALMTRYAGIITHLEVWNESPLDGLAVSGGYFTGTAAEAAAMAKSCYQAAKAIDPNVVVLTPGFLSTYPPETLSTVLPAFLNAPDGAGGFGRQWIDGVALHPYHWLPVSDGFLEYSKWDVLVKQPLVTAALVAGGLSANYPLYSTEAGWITSGDPVGWRTQPDAHWTRWIKRHHAFLAALGYKMNVLFQHGGFHIGYQSENASVRQALDDSNWLNGKTLISLDYMSDTSVRVTSTTDTVFF